MQALAEQL